MATVRKNLGGGSKPAAATLTDHYTAPVSTSAVVSTLMICNQGSQSTTIRVSNAVAGAADTATQYLIYDLNIAANQFLVLTIGMCLAATDVIRVYSNNGNVSFNMWGEEIS